MRVVTWDCSRAEETPDCASPQPHITREGDSYLRMVLVQGAQHIPGACSGEDSDLRRWGTEAGRDMEARAERNARSSQWLANLQFCCIILDQLRGVRTAPHTQKGGTGCGIVKGNAGMQPQVNRRELRRLRPWFWPPLQYTRWNERATIRQQRRLRYREHPRAPSA